MPSQHDAYAFRTTLDATYRDRLGRPPAESFVPAADAVRYTLRYLRYRVYRCDHEQATAHVFTQLEGRGVPDVCGRIDSIAFPPRDQVVDFRRRLEAKFRDERKARPQATHVDLEGDAIWTQEYLRYRLSNCSTTDATARHILQR